MSFYYINVATIGKWKNIYIFRASYVLQSIRSAIIRLKFYLNNIIIITVIINIIQLLFEVLGVKY